MDRASANALAPSAAPNRNTGRWLAWLLGLAALAAVVLITRHLPEAEQLAQLTETAREPA
jgi:hypothetical protein